MGLYMGCPFNLLNFKGIVLSINHYFGNNIRILDIPVERRNIDQRLAKRRRDGVSSIMRNHSVLSNQVKGLFDATR